MTPTATCVRLVPVVFHDQSWQYQIRKIALRKADPRPQKPMLIKLLLTKPH